MNRPRQTPAGTSGPVEKRPGIMLVTCSVDLGSATLATNFVATLRRDHDVTVYDFAPKRHRRFRNGRFEWLLDVARRAATASALWRAMCRARREGRKIVVLGTTPALYGAPAARGADTVLITDWTKKLYEPIVPGHRVAEWVTHVQGRAFRRYGLCVALTDQVERSLASDYGVAASRLVRSPMPFLPIPRNEGLVEGETPNLRILFVGGDFWRKGGATLLRWVSSGDRESCQLDIVTRSEVSIEHPCVRVHRNVSYRDAAYTRLFSKADVFALPTKFDAYPMALGEALAAGLAIVVDRRALGASEVVQDGVNGFITGSEEDFASRLDELARNRVLVSTMKARSAAIYAECFAPAPVSARLRELIGAELATGEGREATG